MKGIRKIVGLKHPYEDRNNSHENVMKKQQKDYRATEKPKVGK